MDLRRNSPRADRHGSNPQTEDARAAARQRAVATRLMSDSATAATEYAVLTVVIAIGVLIAMGGFGDSLNGIYLAISSVMAAIS